MHISTQCKQMVRKEEPSGLVRYLFLLALQHPFALCLEPDEDGAAENDRAEEPHDQENLVPCHRYSR